MPPDEPPRWAEPCPRASRAGRLEQPHRLRRAWSTYPTRPG